MSTHYNECSDFWNEHPCNAKHGDRSLPDPEYFAQVRAKKARAEPHLVPFMEAGRWKSKPVLDVGCGLGTQAVWFAQAGAIVTATDYSEVSIDMAIRHAHAASVQDRIFVNYHDWEGFVPRMLHYDLIWAWGSLHHMRDPARVLRGLRSHCAGPNTVLKVMLYHSHSTKAIWLRLRHGRDWRQWTEANGPVPISNAYSTTEALAMVELAGWKVTSLQVTHIFPWRVSAYKRGEFKKAFPWNLVPARAFGWLEERYGFHILISAVPR